MKRGIILIALAAIFVANVSFAGIVKKIEINGNQRIESETVLVNFGYKVGDNITALEIDEALKRLYSTGLFRNVEVAEHQGIVKIKLDESPMIHTLQIEGNKRIKSDDILPELSLSSRSILSQNKVLADISTIQRLYQRSGRYDIKVTPKIIELANNRVNLVYEVEEGPKTLVGKFTFIGNNNVSDGKLREILSTKEDTWYRFLSDSPKMDIDKLNFDREMLLNFYKSRGYADINISQPIVEYTLDNKSFAVTFMINEGRVYRYGDIKIRNNIKNLEDEHISELSKLIRLKPGSTYDGEEIASAMEVLTNSLGNKGFAFVDIIPEELKQDDRVDLTFIINDAPKYYVNQVNIKGNIRTVDKVVRREFKIAEGDAFRQQEIQNAEKRIHDLDFFEKVDIDTRPAINDDNKVDINVEVKEKSTGHLNFGIGVSSVQGLLGRVQFNETNLTGRGQELMISVSKASRDTDLEVSFTEPYFMDKDISVGVDFDSLHQDKSDLRRFSRVTNGFTLRTNYDLTENLKHGVFYKIRKERIGDLDNNASIMLREQKGSKLVSSIGHSFLWNTVDSKAMPTRGYRIKIGQEFAGLGGNSRFLRHDLYSTYYHPLYKQDVILQLTGNVGHIKSIAHRKILIADRFFLGGDSLRGFREYGISPRDKVSGEALGGNVVYQAKAQVSFPLGLPKELDIRGIVFADLGSVYGLDYGNYDYFNKDNVFDSSSPRSSIGTGVLWNSPIGGIGISYAQPLSKESFDREKKFLFNVQTEF